jgi:hypothetical protein
MLRSKWEFEYTAAKLASAAEAQLAFRKSRVEFWTKQQADVIAKIKATGLEVHEDIAALLSNANKYGGTAPMGGAQIVIDPTMQSDLNKCFSKVSEHTAYVGQYSAWVQVLKGNPEARVKLDHDDWMFFFGK